MFRPKGAHHIVASREALRPGMSSGCLGWMLWMRWFPWKIGEQLKLLLGLDVDRSGVDVMWRNARGDRCWSIFYAKITLSPKSLRMDIATRRMLAQTRRNTACLVRVLARVVMMMMVVVGMMVMALGAII